MEKKTHLWRHDKIKDLETGRIYELSEWALTTTIGIIIKERQEFFFFLFLSYTHRGSREREE